MTLSGYTFVIENHKDNGLWASCFFFYCFLGYTALEVLVYLITKDRKNKEKEKKARAEAEMDEWLGVLSACYHHATRKRRLTNGIYLCVLSKCCWMLRHSQMCDNRVALLALRGLGYLDNADDLEGRPGLRDFGKLDRAVKGSIKVEPEVDEPKQ